MGEAVTAPRDRGSFWRATGVILLLSVLLFWAPAIGTFIAGFVGGRIANTYGKAFAASLMPAIVVAALVGGILAAFELPLIGSVAGIAIFVWILVEDIPLVIGSLVGAATTE